MFNINKYKSISHQKKSKHKTAVPQNRTLTRETEAETKEDSHGLLIYTQDKDTHTHTHFIPLYNSILFPNIFFNDVI